MLKSLGVTKGEKSTARSHIVVGKGGAIEDLQIGISPGQHSLTQPVVNIAAHPTCVCRLGRGTWQFGQPSNASWRQYECNTLRTVSMGTGDSFAKAVATILKSSGKSEPEADKEAEEIAENAPGDDEEKPEEDEEKPKKKAKSAKGGKKK